MYGVLLTLGGSVKIVNGGYRGVQATLDSVDIDNYCATVTISEVSVLCVVRWNDVQLPDYKS